MTDKHCPLTQQLCMLEVCGWYSEKHECCGVVAVAEKLEPKEQEKD